MDLASIFPSGVIWKVAEDWMWDTPLCPEEEALIVKAVDKRKREFRAGRNCAHDLIKAAGIQCDALLKGKQREPNWPAGWVGSISHTQGLCVVAIANQNRFRSIGLDVEQATPLGDDVRNMICSAPEQDRLSRLAFTAGQEIASKPMDKVIFSAKESIHKTYFPLNYHTLDFLDAQVDIDVGSCSFEATILNPEPSSNVVIRTLRGKYCIDQSYVATFISLEA